MSSPTAHVRQYPIHGQGDTPNSSGWISPESTVYDFGDVQPPRCPKTKLSMRDHADSADRHCVHRSIFGRKVVAKKRRGRPELSEAQNRALFSEGADPADFVGYKLTRRQRAQLKVLRKARRVRLASASDLNLTEGLLTS